jgi:hypothetical protein
MISTTPDANCYVGRNTKFASGGISTSSVVVFFTSGGIFLHWVAFFYIGWHFFTLGVSFYIRWCKQQLHQVFHSAVNNIDKQQQLTTLTNDNYNHTSSTYHTHFHLVMLQSSITRKRKAIEVKPSAALIASLRELFTFSPFGLCCRQCNKGATIQLDKRSIQIHLKNHGLDSRVATVHSLFVTFQTQLDNVKALGTIEPYCSDNKAYIGYSCICGHVIQFRKDSALRHCRKIGCDVSKLQKINLIKLCCGRYVSQSQVTSLFNEQKQIFERPSRLSPNAVVNLGDFPPIVSPLSSIEELFTFSPFGLQCRQCKKGTMIQLDERSISDHLKNHLMDSRISIVRSILMHFTRQVNSAKASGTIEPYQSNDKLYRGYSCNCGQVFPIRKDNAL